MSVFKKPTSKNKGRCVDENPRPDPDQWALSGGAEDTDTEESVSPLSEVE